MKRKLTRSPIDIVIASGSPSRRGMLRRLGFKLRMIPSSIPEKHGFTDKPEEFATSLALTKARSVAEKLRSGIVIGLDTVIVHEGEILSKPTNEDDAIEMLKRLSGSTHRILTGIAIMDIETGRQLVDYELSKVKMRKLTEEEIRQYVSTGEPIGKVGAYAIQGAGSVLVDRLDGCYYNIAGLPISKLATMMKSFGKNLLHYHVSHNKR